ncbi:hypothetical protein [Nocardia sp. NBC_00511]
MEELLEAADQFAVGELYSEDLPMVAANALARVTVRCRSCCA